MHLQLRKAQVLSPALLDERNCCVAVTIRTQSMNLRSNLPDVPLATTPMTRYMRKCQLRLSKVVELFHIMPILNHVQSTHVLYHSLLKGWSMRYSRPPDIAPFLGVS